MNNQDWFPLGLTGLISLQSKGFSRVFSNPTVQKHKFFCAQPSLWSNSHIPYMTTGKTVILEKIEGKRRRWQQRIRWLDGLTDSTDMSLSKPQETAKDRKAWPVHRIAKMSDTTERLNNNPEEASSSHSSLSFESDKRYSCSS